MLVAKTRKGLSIALAALMLVAQTVYAVDACVNAAASAARAIASADMPGCEKMKFKSSCLQQCNLDSQSSAHPVFTIPPMPVDAVMTLPEMPEIALSGQTGYRLPAHALGPAPPLQFCRLLL